MARHQTLSWFAPRRCWKKKYRNQVYYVGPRGINKTDNVAYQQALAEWREIEAKLAAEDGDRQEAERRQGIIEGNRDIMARADGVRGLSKDNPFRQMLGTVVGEQAREAGIDHMPEFDVGDADLAARPKPATTSLIRHHVDSFLTFYRALARSGTKSINRADNLRRYLATLTDWHETDGLPTTGDRPATDITASFVRGYFTYLLARTQDGTMAPATAHGAFIAAKQFIRHIWREDVIGLPRNLDDRNLRIEVPAPDVQTFTPAQINSILTTATGPTKLYCLLGLNTGMTAKDISDLQPTEVNWTAGTIRRQRSKTRKKGEHVPTITYTLWPETMKLLRQHRADSRDNVLLNTNGTPLVRQAIKADGKMQRTDAIRLAFRRLAQKIDRQVMDGTKGIRATRLPQEFTRLRRTGATLIANHFDEGLAEYWLGHTPKTVAGRHYIAPNADRLTQAIQWLGGQIGTAKTSNPRNVK